MSQRHIDPASIVHPNAKVGAGCYVWAWSQIREGATIGPCTSIGQGAYVGPGVVVGGSCKIQNYALIYEPAVLEDSVFVGPGAVLTNDRYPRAVNLDGSEKSAGDWNPVGVYVERGASIGAKAVLVGPVRIGTWSMVGAGSVVSADVKPYSLVVGIPAAHVGWIGRSGHRLVKTNDGWVCPDSGERFEELEGHLGPAGHKP
jgi:UDP-3-O-[3-hydroxymyristoyl] glucosamine N-acyltransferase